MDHANKAIECNVVSCRNHCASQDYCSLDHVRIGTHECHVPGRPQRLGQGPFDEPHDAVADEMAVLLVGVLGKPPQGQHGVAGHGQVADGIEQRAVEVEDDEFGFHGFRFIFQPTAATNSDISGETILKMQ